MSTKPFLPLHKFNIAENLGDAGKSIFTGNLSPTRKPASRLRTLCTKIFPVFGVMSITFFLSMVGISIFSVGKDQVGYVQAEDSAVFGEGMYIQLPWNRQNVVVADLKSKTIQIWKESVPIANGNCFIDYIMIRFDVTNTTEFVSKLREYDGEKNAIRKLSDIVMKSITASAVNATIEYNHQITFDEINISPEWGITIVETRFEGIKFTQFTTTTPTTTTPTTTTPTTTTPTTTTPTTTTPTTSESVAESVAERVAESVVESSADEDRAMSRFIFPDLRSISAEDSAGDDSIPESPSPPPTTERSIRRSRVKRI